MITIDEVEQQLKQFEVLERALTYDVIVQTAAGAFNPAAHARFFAVFARQVLDDRCVKEAARV